MAKDIGFKSFKEVYTPRFWSKEGQRLEFKTKDENYLLEPSTIEKNKIDNKKLGEHFSFQNKDRDKEAGYIECKALKINEFFLVSLIFLIFQLPSNFLKSPLMRLNSKRPSSFSSSKLIVTSAENFIPRKS